MSTKLRALLEASTPQPGHMDLLYVVQLLTILPALLDRLDKLEAIVEESKKMRKRLKQAYYYDKALAALEDKK